MPHHQLNDQINVLSEEHIVNKVEDIMEVEIHVIDVPPLSDPKEQDEKPVVSDDDEEDKERAIAAL
ncbi:uncharacterized protein G2W53_004392 [Senna tora]|uniref:Uncharacterized protein n=1 Tax=Senna tora TaxID=362788 RepID=A0A834XBS2_9FABA|nr:uncharacterized protein G2W53_004392 [Senna tora]